MVCPPKEYADSVVSLRPGLEISRDKLLNDLVDIQFERNDIDFQRGNSVSSGDVVEFSQLRAMNMPFGLFLETRLSAFVRLKL